MTVSTDTPTLRLTKVKPEIWLGNGMGTARASWNLLLEDRRVAHIYHNGTEWVYRLDSNPYVQHRGSRWTRNQVVAEVRQAIADNPVHRDFWLSGEFEDRRHWLETQDGPLVLITGINFGRGDVWIVNMIFGNYHEEFRQPGEAVEWAIEKAQKWLEKGRRKRRTDAA